MSQQYFEEEEFSTQFTGKTTLRIVQLAKPHWKWVLGFLLTISLVALGACSSKVSSALDPDKQAKVEVVTKCVPPQIERDMVLMGVSSLSQIDRLIGWLFHGPHSPSLWPRKQLTPLRRS